MATTIELYANNAYSTLANSIDAGATTINIAPGTGSSFPSPTGDQFFRLTITSAASPNTDIEIVHVTSRSSDSLTVARGREGTVARSWNVNDLCANEATAATYNQFVQPFSGIDTGAINAYVVNTPQHETAYYTGMMCIFWTLNSNSSLSPTLNLNGLGARNIRNADGSNLVSGQLPANTPICCVYNSYDSTWRLYNPLGMQKQALLNQSRAVITDSSGNLSTSTATSAEVGYLSGVQYSVQQQIDAKTFYADFSAALQQQGYQKIANGLIIQWGGIANIPAGSAVVNVNLSIPWPITYIGGVVSDVGNGCVPYAIGQGSTNDKIKIFAPYAFLNGIVSTTTPQVRGVTSANWVAWGY